MPAAAQKLLCACMQMLFDKAASNAQCNGVRLVLQLDVDLCGINVP